MSSIELWQLFSFVIVAIFKFSMEEETKMTIQYFFLLQPKEEFAL
jgi:hypothetical protein